MNMIADINSTRNALIREAAAMLAARHPHAAETIDRAAGVCVDGTIRRLDDYLVNVDSPSGQTYPVVRFDTADPWKCYCKAFAYSPVTIKAVHHCKHTLAVVIDGRATARLAEVEEVAHVC